MQYRTSARDIFHFYSGGKKTTFITSFINVEKTRHKHPLYVVYADSMNITQTKHPYSLLIRHIQTIYGALAPNLEQNID